MHEKGQKNRKRSPEYSKKESPDFSIHFLKTQKDFNLQRFFILN